MRILLVDLDPPTRILLQATLRDHAIALGDTQDAATVLRILAGSWQPIVVIVACRPSAWWDSADLLNMIADNPTLATGHRFIVLANLNDTMPPSPSRATLRLPIHIAAQPTTGADLGVVVAQLVRQIADDLMAATATTSDPTAFEPSDLAWASV